MNLYDFIYVDLEKVISVYSQMTGGIVEVRERNNENSRSSDNKRNYDFKVFKHDAGGTTVHKSGSREVVKPHHALLIEMEEALLAKGYLVDLTNPETAMSFRDSEFRARLKDTFCVKVRGRAVIEDYERLKSIGGNWPEVTNLINKSLESVILTSPEFLKLQNLLKEAQELLTSTKDRKARLALEREIKSMTETLRQALAATNISGVDQWVLDGIATWVNAFLPGIINLRIYPYTDRPAEHIFGHLKKQCFADADSSSFHFTYGSFPTESLTMIGIVTSVPEEDGEQFNPLSEFLHDQPTEQETVEQGFRGGFRGFDGMEQMIRTCRYPRVLVQPLTVYRSVASGDSRYQSSSRSWIASSLDKLIERLGFRRSA